MSGIPLEITSSLTLIHTVNVKIRKKASERLQFWNQ
jgi:hypothetical protein